MKILGRVYLIALVLAVGVFQSSAALAIPTPTAEITYLETELGGGSFLYEFTVNNTSDPAIFSDFKIYDFFIDFDPAIFAEVVSEPTGWLSFADVGFVSSIAWEGAEIATGSSLGGFNFVLDGMIGVVPFSVDFIDSFGAQEQYLGNATPVPEPATILLLAAGIGGLGFAKRRRLMSL